MLGMRLALAPLVLVILGVCGFSSGCVSPRRPLNEYNLARTALEAAQGVKSEQHAPVYWSRAQRAYRRGEIEFQKGAFDKAKASFKQAKLFAERAENFTAIKVMSEGGSR